MKRASIAKSLLLSALCGGCASTPLHYYTLTRPARTVDPAVSAVCCQVQIKRLGIPAAVDRPELVLRSGEDQARVLSNDVWLAPLRDEIRDALRAEIELQLSKAPPTAGSSPRRYLLQMEITRFESAPGAAVVVSADWRLQSGATPGASLSCTSHQRIVVAGDVSAAVQGYQQALSQIADQIAASVLVANGSDAARCP